MVVTMRHLKAKIETSEVGATGVKRPGAGPIKFNYLSSGDNEINKLKIFFIILNLFNFSSKIYFHQI